MALERKIKISPGSQDYSKVLLNLTKEPLYVEQNADRIVDLYNMDREKFIATVTSPDVEALKQDSILNNKYAAYEELTVRIKDKFRPALIHTCQRAHKEAKEN